MLLDHSKIVFWNVVDLIWPVENSVFENWKLKFLLDTTTYTHIFYIMDALTEEEIIQLINLFIIVCILLW